MIHKTLLDFIIIELVIIATLSSSIGFMLAYLCGIHASIPCDKSVHHGAVIAFVATAVALVGAGVTAGLIHWKQTRFCDKCQEEQNKRLDRIESNINKILKRYVDEKPNGQ